jgi:hypothetical protein
MSTNAEKVEKIKVMFYDPKQGLWSINKIHEKLNEQGMKVSLSDVRNVLQNQLVNQVFKPVGKYKKEGFTTITAKYPREQYQCDLIDFKKYYKFNGNYRYLLNCIDVYSRFATSVPLKNKDLKSVYPAIEKVFAEMGYCKNFNSDLEAAFLSAKFQALLKEHKIVHWQHDPIENKRNMSIVERFNKTIRTVIQKYFYVRGTKNWVKVLPDLMNNYNTTEHSTIQQEPKDMFTDTKKDPSYKSKQKVKVPVFTLMVGDKVRVLKRYSTFTKKTDVKNWTKNIYTITKIDGQTFYVKSDKGVMQKRKEYELQKVDPDEVGTLDDVKGDEGDAFKEELKVQRSERRFNKADLKSDLVNTAPAKSKREVKPAKRFDDE